MKINCLSCGHTIDLDEIYSDYEGQIKCFTCGAILEVKLSDSLIVAVRIFRETGSGNKEAIANKVKQTK